MSDTTDQPTEATEATAEVPAGGSSAPVSVVLRSQEKTP